jgi:nucleoside-diphosphate-sugar epimerase
MHIIITGSKGLIGRRVVLLALKQGHRVLAVDTQPAPKLSNLSYSKEIEADEAEDVWAQSQDTYTYISADLRSYDAAYAALSTKGIGAVIHLAGIPQPLDGVVEAHNTYVCLLSLCPHGSS